MDWKSKYYLLIKKVQDIDNDMGIYPKAVKGHNDERDYEQRDGFKNGWNAAIMEYGIAITHLGYEAEKEMSPEELMLLASEYCSFREDGSLVINLNDTFAWACSDCEIIDKSDISEVARLFSLYGRCGILYWVSKKRGGEKSEFKDINRFINFVDCEESLLERIPEDNKRAYESYTYTLGDEPKRK